jgi:hypothetical protein
VLEHVDKVAHLHGVQGVECSNHSVPTIFLNDLAQSSQVGLFHVCDFCLAGSEWVGN